jgi:hypothetical protein
MPTIVAVDNEFATVRVLTEKRIIHHEFKQFIHGSAFREALTAGAELMEKHRATRWLSDDRKNGALPTPDAQWARTVWYPRVLKAGWKRWAVVLPEMLVGQMNMKRFVDDYQKDGIEARLFSDPAAAMTWLAGP